MASPAVIPDLPAEFLASDDPLVGMFLPVGIAAHADLVDAAAKFETLREAEVRASAALDSSEDPSAVAYRQAREATVETVESIKAARDKELDEIRKRYNTQIEAANKELDTLKVDTLKSIQVDTISDINVDELVSNYTAKMDAAKILGRNLKEQCPQLAEWVKSLPSKVAQSGGSGPDSRDRNWTPRFASIVVTDPEGKEIVPNPVTLGATAKIVGGTRQFHAKQLLGAIGDPSNLSNDPANPSVYEVKNNGKVWTVSVVERVNDSDD